jgi:hypothetical protein
METIIHNIAAKIRNNCHILMQELIPEIEKIENIHKKEIVLLILDKICTYMLQNAEKLYPMNQSNIYSKKHPYNK